MEDDIKKLRQGLTPIKISDRKCNAFMGITDDIKRWGNFVPMITDLKNDSMITPDGRHWKKVKGQLNQ